MPALKILLDTDIGDDIDDAIALALICRSPELELVGVTTVFGNVLARARQVQTMLQVAGGALASVPVAAGCGATLASRKLTRVQADLDNVPGQAPATWAADQLPPLDRRHGVDLMIDLLMTGDVIPVTIGALTNLAVALTKEPRLRTRIPRVVTMAAEFERPMAEWNVRCDPEAAHLVFSSGLRMDVLPFIVGRTARFSTPQLHTLAANTHPIARHLWATIVAWRSAWKQPTALPSLYDPMTVASLIDPRPFTWTRGTVHVDLRGDETYGRTTFTTSDDGPHALAGIPDSEGAVGWLLNRLISAEPRAALSET